MQQESFDFGEILELTNVKHLIETGGVDARTIAGSLHAMQFQAGSR